MGGGCQPGTPVDCDDGVGCTTDVRQEPTGSCVNTPVDAACDDGLFGNGDDACDALLDCQPATAPNCDDGATCTNDSYDEVNDTCTNTPSDALCDDGQFCDGVEVCDPLLYCQARPIVCDDGFDCSTERYDETIDMCVSDETSCICGDGLPGPGEQCAPRHARRDLPRGPRRCALHDQHRLRRAARRRPVLARGVRPAELGNLQQPDRRRRRSAHRLRRSRVSDRRPDDLR
ncbi:MAG: hypothetical protein E4H03_07885 [Myxococcales bacterium]|nr:MAG: hypothetical protein E4H03_07885 [Myxococcales bacterium]